MKKGKCSFTKPDTRCPRDPWPSQTANKFYDFLPQNDISQTQLSWFVLLGLVASTPYVVLFKVKYLSRSYGVLQGVVLFKNIFLAEVQLYVLLTFVVIQLHALTKSLDGTIFGLLLLVATGFGDLGVV